MLTKQERAVLAVLAYSAQFEHPLAEDEIRQRMLRPKGFEKLDEWLASRKNIGFSSKALESLRKKNKISASPRKINGEIRYSLSGFERSFKKVKKSKIFKNKKQFLIDEFLKVVKFIPWIKAVAITGSLSAGGGSASDDVDFLLVTKKNRLWLTRLLLLFISLLKGRRPKLGSDISKSWDLNLWLDEDQLKMNRQRRSVYEAYEIFQIDWIYDIAQIEQRFTQENSWVSNILLYWNKDRLRKGDNKISNPVLKNNLKENLMSLLNKLAFYLEIGYRTIKHGKQRAELGSAFFHGKNTRGNIFKNWKKLYNLARRDV